MTDGIFLTLLGCIDLCSFKAVWQYVFCCRCKSGLALSRWNDDQRKGEGEI